MPYLRLNLLSRIPYILYICCKIFPSLFQMSSFLFRCRVLCFSIPVFPCSAFVFPLGVVLFYFRFHAFFRITDMRIIVCISGSSFFPLRYWRRRRNISQSLLPWVSGMTRKAYHAFMIRAYADLTSKHGLSYTTVVVVLVSVRFV